MTTLTWISGGYGYAGMEGDGGHKGVRSIVDALRSPLFYRMKIGIGRNPAIPAEEYVLSRFQKEEVEDLTDIIDRTVDALHTLFLKARKRR